MTRSHWRRWLYLVHRWVGIVTCLLFAMWFISGLVMIYVPFPSLGKAERLDGMSPIDWPLVRTLPGPELRAAGIDTSSLRALSLEMRGARPVWRAEGWDGEVHIVDAQRGGIAEPAGAVEATAIASAFGRAPVTHIESLFHDQWTVAGGFNRDRPLWKADLAGPGGRVLYISSRTGAVVLDTNRNERFWNWLGSVPHWLYPTVLRQDNGAWRQVVMWVSGPCIVGAVTGMWIGILRLRTGRRRFSRDRMTPYHGWMKWHHLTGLFGGIALILWIFSGWLSVDPFRLFASGGIDQARRAAYMSAIAPRKLSEDLVKVAAGARRIAFFRIADRPLMRIERPRQRTILLDADRLTPVVLDNHFLRRQAAALIPAARIARAELLLRPDAYWYDGSGLPTLPVLRFRFDDPRSTWVHIDPADGSILSELDRRGRLYRWLFDLFHKWDFNWLTLNRPSWDTWLWLLSILGLVTSVSGIKIAWSRLRRPPLPRVERK